MRGPAQKPKRRGFPVLFGGVIVTIYLAAWGFLTLAWDDWDACAGSACVVPPSEMAAAGGSPVNR